MTSRPLVRAKVFALQYLAQAMGSGVYAGLGLGVGAEMGGLAG